MSQVDTNYKYFKDNKKELLSKYLNQYLVIKDKKVEFHSKNFDEAIEYVKKLETGTYILQKCEKDEKSIQTFHTRVSF